MTERLRPGRALLLPPLVVFLLLFALATGARAAWRTAGDVKSVERRADGVMLTLTSGARVAVTYVGTEVVRVRLAPRGTFERDFSYAVEPKERPAMRVAIGDFRAPKGGFEAGSDSIRLWVLGGASVVIRRRPF